MLTLVMYVGFTISRLRNIVLVGIVFVLLLFLIVPDKHRVENITEINQEMLKQGKVNVSVFSQIERKNSLKQQKREEKEARRNASCTFFDPKYNESRPIRCDTGEFVSFVRSQCKTRLGNQMSSYAAALYFKKKYGMIPIMEPFQMNIMKSVFNEDHFTVHELNLATCCARYQKKWPKVKALNEDRRTGVALGLSPKFEKNFERYSRNHIVGLGPHTMPVFLYKDILPELKKEFIFKDRIMILASTFMKTIIEKENGKNLVFVGIHARRGDRIKKWKHKAFGLTVGSFEGKFFNEAMDTFRSRYNNGHQKVVFVPTSDDYFWVKKHLVNKNDTYFSREMVKETRTALPNFVEIGKMWNHWSLAVKGAISYGTDLAILSLCNHTVVDYGTFGLWSGLMAGGKILLPSGYSSSIPSPDMLWWDMADLSNVEYIDVSKYTKKL